MDHLAEHLRFYQELGVTGVSRDAKWRRRDGAAGDAAVGPAFRPAIVTVTVGPTFRPAIAGLA